MESNNLEELFSSLFGSDEEQEEASQYNFSSEGDVDDSIEKLKELDTDIKRFKDLYAEKVEKLKSDLDFRISKLDKKREWILFNIKNSVIAAGDAKETKTMFKKSFLSGDIIIKKEVTKLVTPKFTEEEILADFSDYKKSKSIVSLDWATLKADLKILNGRVICVPTGEDFSDKILIETTPEIVSVK